MHHPFGPWYLQISTQGLLSRFFIGLRRALKGHLRQHLVDTGL